ncbi:MAG: phosphoribosylformylglycinamidine synthase subunit PurL [Thermoplasmata archaeon]
MVATPGPRDPLPAGVASVPVRRPSLASLLAESRRRRWGFDREELGRIRRHFLREGRDPTDVEIAGLAQSWSEHCSYKSSRPFLRRWLGPLRRDRRVLAAGDAGVMRLAPGLAYALRIESHNHPSAVEPYGGAATGIGGILRDVLAVGAKPIALADPLFFGPLNTPASDVPSGVRRPAYLFDGVVAGIRDYGNRVGVPTVAGSVGFDPAYLVNPLVNVGCVGIVPPRRIVPNRARRAGDHVVLVGGRTGRDGIGGVAFASRELTEGSEREERGAVQLGNPILKEPLIHACLEARDRGWIRAMKDLGGGGLATALGELAHAGGLGLRIDLARVPLRDTGLAPWEIWISESQERMALEVRPSDVRTLMALFERYDVPASDLGAFVPGARETILYDGTVVADLDLGFRVDPPAKRRPVRAPSAARHPPPVTPRAPDLGRLVEELLLDPTARSREGVIRQYDHEVQGRAVLGSLHGRPVSPSHGDAAVLRPTPTGPHGIAITVASDPWRGAIDPYQGALAAVEEAARNLYAVGARPDAFSDCLNFGNPEDPRVLGAFDRAVRGLAEGARALGFAVPSGNVSLYNGGIGHAIPPTPVLLATGIVARVERTISSDLKREGNPLFLLGPSRPELGGSLWARRRGGRPLPVPPADPRGLRRRGDALLGWIGRGWVRAAHDVADGGLGVALAEMAFGGGLGFEADLAATGLPGTTLAAIAEGGSRWVLEVDAAAEDRVARRGRALGLVPLGRVLPDPVGRLLWRREVSASLDLAALYPRWRDGPGFG